MPNTSHSKLLPVASGWLQIHSVSLIDDRHGQAVTQSKSNIKFSLIVPTYNESDNIEKIIQVLSSLLNATLPKDYELIVVDDNSPDRILANCAGAFDRLSRPKGDATTA
jgi:dolichol-phosphate mannosyltransferase